MNIYNWTISALECKVKEGNMTDVVYTVHWRYSATNENGITAETYGAQSVAPPTTEAFTPYDQLTKDQVVGWLEASMDVPAINISLDEQIELILHPIDVTPPLPFKN